MKWLILGRTAAGKDMLAKFCEAYGMDRVRSYATRPRRDDDDDGHTFVTPEEAESIGDRVAETRIGDYSYFMTADMVRSADVIVIDPDGLFDLVGNMPEENFCVAIVTAPTDVRRTRYGLRGDDGTSFDERDAAETKRFDTFRDRMRDHVPANVCAVYEVDNSRSDPKALEGFARMMVRWPAGIAGLGELDDEEHFVDWDGSDSDLNHECVLARIYGSDDVLAKVGRNVVSDERLGQALRKYGRDAYVADVMRCDLAGDVPVPGDDQG